MWIMWQWMNQINCEKELRMPINESYEIINKWITLNYEWMNQMNYEYESHTTIIKESAMMKMNHL